MAFLWTTDCCLYDVMKSPLMRVDSLINASSKSEESMSNCASLVFRASHPQVEFGFDIGEEPYGSSSFWILDDQFLHIILDDLKRIFPIEELKLLTTGMSVPAVVTVLHIWQQWCSHQHAMCHFSTAAKLRGQLEQICRGMNSVHDAEEGCRLYMHRQAVPCLEHRLLRRWCLHTLSPVWLRIDDRGYLRTQGSYFFKATFLWISNLRTQTARFVFFHSNQCDILTVDLHYSELCYVDFLISRDRSRPRTDIRLRDIGLIARAELRLHEDSGIELVEKKDVQLALVPSGVS